MIYICKIFTHTYVDIVYIMTHLIHILREKC